MGTTPPVQWALDKRRKLQRYATDANAAWRQRARDVLLVGVPLAALDGCSANGGDNENTTGWVSYSPDERDEALRTGRKPLGGDPSKGYGNVNSTDLNELGRFGVEGARLPALVATPDDCPWVAGARSDGVAKVLGRAGVEGRNWYGRDAVADQIVVGVWNLRRHLNAIRRRIDPRLAWPEGDKPVTAWAYSLAMMSWSAGSGGASKHVNAYADELAALPEVKRWGAFMRLAARDDSDARKHRADEYSALRTEQKRRAGVLACTFTGEDASWFDDGLTEAERDEVHAALVRVSK